MRKKPTSTTPWKPIVKIYVVRHGETQENREGIIQGQLDTKLNETGIQQAEITAELFKNIPLTAAFTSDLTRAKTTAEIILKHHPSVRLNIDPGLRERHLGARQGLKARERPRPTADSEEGENREVFTERVMTWWEKKIADNLPAIPVDIDIVHVLAVSHGAYIATLIRTLLVQNIVSAGRAERELINVCYNTSVTTIEMGRDKRGLLRKYSDISHLLSPVVQTNADVEESSQG